MAWGGLQGGLKGVLSLQRCPPPLEALHFVSLFRRCPVAFGDPATSSLQTSLQEKVALQSASWRSHRHFSPSGDSFYFWPMRQLAKPGKAGSMTRFLADFRPISLRAAVKVLKYLSFAVRRNMTKLDTSAKPRKRSLLKQC
jgi:hypothetical protein